MLVPGRKAELIRLVRKVLNGKATEEETRFLKEYYDYFDSAELESSGLSPEEKLALENKLLKRINLGINDIDGKRRTILFGNRFLRIAAAAAVFIIIGSACYWYMVPVKKDVNVVTRSRPYKGEDVVPGGNKAVLTLANGSKVILDSAHNGEFARQGATSIVKIKSGQLAYDKSKSGPPAPRREAIQYNTLTTPRGGQYQVTLPDGTEVWLNASTSLTYPTAFSGKERKVTLKGEAYFEVVKNEKMPFKVQVGSVEIEDFGTHFNVMAYSDEPRIKTTLLEGSVAVIKGEKSALLEPGQQAVVKNGAASAIHIKKVNTDDVVAWKNGFFSFHNTDIYEIMRQISRWYNVDVSYVDSPAVYLNGSIRRDVNASQVFKMLELTGELDFTIEGERVIVKGRHKE